MKKKLCVFCIFIFMSSVIFSISAQDIISKLEESSYMAKRIFIEESDEYGSKLRYETVYKWGDDKLVLVKAPREFVWLRRAGECWMGEKVLYIMPVDLKDLEDLAVENFYEADNVKFTNDDGEYKLSFSTSKGKFILIVSEDLRPLKVERYIKDIKMILEYKEFYKGKDEKKVLKEYKFSKKLALPQEIADVIGLLDWFTISEKEDDMIKIKGLFDGKFINIEISVQPTENSVRVGRFFVSSDSKEFLKELER